MFENKYYITTSYYSIISNCYHTKIILALFFENDLLFIYNVCVYITICDTNIYNVYI